MSTGGTAMGQNEASRPGDGDRAPGRWRPEAAGGLKMSTLGGQGGQRRPPAEPEPAGGAASAPLFGPGGLASPGEAAPPAPEPPFAGARPGPYARPPALAFPQPPLGLGALHGAKPPPGLDGPPWLFPGPLPPVAAEDLFPYPLPGPGAAYPRKKLPGLGPAYGQYAQKSLEAPDEAPRKEHKPKKPGKYICPYCSRACAKPSVLKKHIRSHTGERPYPCVPCGFSFKTKSNLYKHRKSHAHAIKAGLVPFTEAAVSKLDLEASFIDVEAEIHSDGEQSTDTDEEAALFAEAPGKLSPGPPGALDLGARAGFHGSLEEALGGPLKVPLLIIPKGGLPAPHDSPQYAGPEMLPAPAAAHARPDDSHTVKQKLALRLSEKKGQDAEPALNLLSPHSKGSTDSGYFSRSESAEQQISPPNTNAKSYEEIIFGKFCRLSPRNVLGVVGAGDERAVLGRKGTLEALPPAGARLDVQMFEDPAAQLVAGQGDVDPGQPRLLKSPTFNCEPRVPPGAAPSGRNEPKLYGAHLQGSSPVLLEAPVDSSPLIRSNSMPTSSATSLSLPPSLRGSHSFDERMTGSDDVFYPGPLGLPPQRMLRRQAAFELPSVQEGHGELEHHGRASSRDKKLLPGDRAGYDYDACRKPYKKWEEPGMPKQTCRDLPCLGSLKHGGEYALDAPAVAHGLPPLFGTTCETRKRRKEKSVGDEEDAPMVCGGAGGVPLGLVAADYDPRLQGQEGARGRLAAVGQETPPHGSCERADPGGPHLQGGGAALGAEDALGADAERPAEPGGRKPPGNVISVIQHTNSLSRPSSFERSESAELAAGAADKALSPSETCDSEVSEAPASPEWASPGDGAEGAGKPPAQGPQPPGHAPPRLVRQHNIQVPEIRVTEEPDKPDRERDAQSREPEKPVEEFQWPQRSETLSQLPAEKLPPKKKRLRLAEMEHSSGESSFESTGTGLSRSPSQESNLSHSSSFSMSFERDEAVKLAAPAKQDEFGKPSEFLTVPGGSYSLSVPGHPQKEMRRSSSEQTPCPPPAEVPEVRSKSFDYGNLSHAPAPGRAAAALSPPRERKKCFLVRQASFSGSPETAPGEAGAEQAVKQEQMEQLHAGLRAAWAPCPGPLPRAPDEPAKQGLGPCAPLGAGSFHLAQRQVLHLDSAEALRHPLGQPASYLASKHFPEQPHLFPSQETVPFAPMQDALFQFQYPAVSMVPLPTQQPPWWQVQFPPPLAPAPSKGYDKPPFPAEMHAGYPFELASKPPGKEPPDYAHRAEHAYPCYSGASGLASKKSLLPTSPSDQSAKPPHPPAEQLLPEDLAGAASLQSLPGTVVPVRIQTHVPSYGSVMYTSISQMLGHNSPAIVICKVSENTTERTLVSSAATQGLGLDIAQVLGQHAGLEKYPLWKVPQTLPLGLESSIPLCLPSTSDSAASLGGSKRMLSPASSLELFMETKQQKRVKEEKMYGQIVEELSAVELTSSDIKKHLTRPPKPQLVRQGCASEPKDGSQSRSSSFSSLSPSSSQDQPPAGQEPFSLGREPLASSRAAPVGQQPRGASESKESSDELDIDETASDVSMSPQGSTLPPGDLQPEEQGKGQRLPLGMLLHVASGPGGKAASSTLLFTDVVDFQQLLQFPSLRTTTTVSWCFLNYTKPSCVQQATFKSSVYASWCISSCNPNPSGLNTKTTLALLRSKQKITAEIYTLAAMHRPGSGKLTSSSAWKQFAQMKPDAAFLFGSKLERKLVGSALKERGKGDIHGDKDIGSKQTEPIRIKIFEGGYKSNEDYVYVRGRGRGKYICEECGIRCKKPSMLKKHIRTHTDVRPYVCKLCNFAFKTKGNLTKHMKSKAHMKKCLELGVSMTSVDDTETEEAENMEDLHKAAEKHSLSSLSTDHQFSDAEESDGEDGDDNDDDDEDDDDFDDQGELTPKTRSRSTSPQPPRFSSLPVNVGAVPPGGPADGPLAHSSLMSYLVTLPSIQVTQLVTPSDTREDARGTAYQRLFQSRSTDSEPDKDRLGLPGCMEEDLVLSSEAGSSPRDFSPASHRSSPGYDSSPCRENSPKRYLMPKGDLSPRRHLSPRRELSPLRHLSPRKEAALRRELSQRDVSPRRHLSPRRPVSPGKDVMARRDLSPRRERRYKTTVRAPSPRRALYPNPLLPLGQYLQAEPILLAPPNLRRGPPQVPYFGLYGDPEGAFEHQGPSLAPEPPADHVFSHLPLHSQLQVRAPVPMVPVGGIQLVHSVPPALPGFHPPSVPLPMEGSEEKRGAFGEPFARELSPLSKRREGRAAPGLRSSGRPSAPTSPRLLVKQSTSEDSLNAAEREQEENLQTCTKAIASLRIAAEEASLLGAEQARAPEPQQGPWEGAHAGIRPFSGPEPGPACPSAAPADPQEGQASFGTSQTALAHSTFYSQGGLEEKQPGFPDSQELASSTGDGQEPASLEKSQLQ
ncbi:transcription factor HIVEP2 [Dasypus novemcinctus]|uniref:transcription factor HIVEP2 n=1 Tax=Dasypus novemcinctus TaxID=9361 RepID=UPI0026602495|nr:transcription factor HIVEP2 [Dasypus novemcinctus]XP_058163549.1 transcription factor HIVEP2 [Dasypus novemcinctus]XP_058163550.1 transcription factor HIVEP2 [Dasypus novemcinctus]XP_058163551.1 transcription factor HIVEP2 [Dasypus novemcinctus]XP_058163552.1 transcription factor HIVEP2 [Dasypus novemcinctus]XP_058163553.1 transcription factor HIVEP2 [Dasypus novemcinctus]XP_058163554.1 transcription factor HIVEP2 [Dasypus novemcinctus]XP_058163555.1 transcription factor HIVEP2 [Dasypus n